MIKSSVILAALLLVGCNTVKFSTGTDANTAPLELSQTCDLIPVELEKSAKSSMGNLTTAYDNLVSQYAVCASMDQVKYDWIKTQGH